MRWYCTGTSIACVTRCRSHSCKNFSSSNLCINTVVAPLASDGSSAAIVVFEYSGVEMMFTA